MRVTLRQVVAAARSREASLAAESAGYILLAVADQVAIAPRRVGLSGVDLGDEGKVRLSSSEPSTEQVAEADLRALLEQLLLVASSSTPALLRVSRHADTTGLGALVRELEAALIPVNRAAAQRALARLVRETARALERGLELTEERIESPLVSALLATPAPVTEARRTPSVPPPSLTLREVSSPAPPVAVKVPVSAPELPIPALEVPLVRAPLRPEASPQPTVGEAALVEPVPAILEPLLEVDVEVEVGEERPPREAETRPEPVIRRSVAPVAAAGPPAPFSPPVETPRLGTLVAVASVFQEAPPAYDLTERMPPVALDEGWADPLPGPSEDHQAGPEGANEESSPLAVVEPVIEASTLAVAEPVHEARASVTVVAPVETVPALSAEPIEPPAVEPSEEVPALELDAVEPDPENAVVEVALEGAGEEPIATLEAEGVADAISSEASVEPIPEPLEDIDIVIEEGPVEFVFSDSGLALAEAGGVEAVPEMEIELAFTPSPHRATSVTLEELRGPNFEPEPDYEPEPLPEYEPEPEPEPTPPSLPRVQLRREPLRSDVQDLLRGFRNETEPSEPDISRELRMLAGLDLTPPPTTAGER